MQLLKKVLNFSAERYLKTAGDLFIYHSDYAGALEMVEKALKHEPDDTRALVLQGDILFCLNRDTEALDSFNQALQTNSELAEAYISKAGVLEVMGRYREAMWCCQRALTSITEDKQYLYPSLYDQLILLLIRLKRFRHAEQVLLQSANHLSDHEYEYLVASYRGLIDQLIKNRKSLRKQQPEQGLSVVKCAP